MEVETLTSETMKTDSLIKSLKKHGLEPIMSQVVGRDMEGNEYLCSKRYFVQGAKHYCTWIDQQGSAMCVSVCPNHDKDEIESDYHAGMFANTIKIAVKWLMED